MLLKPDDYALMIHYFSTLKVDDWEKRRERLNTMIGDDAVIYNVYSQKDQRGMAVYNKEEFIDKLTMPSGSLRNIHVLDSKFKDGKIILLKFQVKEAEK